MKMDWRIVFVVLHYCAVDSTREAIQSIQNCCGLNQEIVVVDNASPDQSGERLKEEYKNCRKIHILQGKENVGFAKGNNCGYRYAREVLRADFIICINNDVIVRQKNFVDKIKRIYEEEVFHILGPDIVDMQGKHHNPHRLHTFEKKDLRRIIRNRGIILIYLKLKKMFRLEERVQLIEKWDSYRAVQERSDIPWEKKQENIVLQGSCFVFSPLFVKQEEEAFYPETFMYLEEEILTFLSSKKHYQILYSPEIQVLHKEEVSTNSTVKKSEKYMFFSRELRKSAKLFLKLEKNWDNLEKIKK